MGWRTERDEEVPGDQRRDPDGATDLYRTVGKQLRLLRERAELTQRELGHPLGYSEELISSLERGRRTPQPELLDAADTLLGADGLLRAARDDVARAKERARLRHPAWFRDYARLESEAVEIGFYSTLTVPGLLQTEDYARAVFSAYQPPLPEEEIEQRLSARLLRQDLLRPCPAPMVTAVIDESVLLRRVGGVDVLRGQLRHLLELGRLRSTTIHVLPLASEEHAGLEGPFVLLTPKGRQQVGYMEVQDVSRLITDQEEVRILGARYGNIRGHALTPGESRAVIETTLGEL